jgi:hypothetical protein
MILNKFKMKLYSKQDLRSLFLMCSLPLHFWTLLLTFRDTSWLIERSNLWDAIGVASYGLIFAFVESLLVFLIVAISGFIIPKHWQSQRVALLSILTLITALWSMASQAHAISGMSFPVWFSGFIVRQEHPVRVLYAIALVLVSSTVILPTYLILNSDRSFRLVRELIDRLSMLAVLYLVFDSAALVIIIIRNI